MDVENWEMGETGHKSTGAEKRNGQGMGVIELKPATYL